MRLNDGGRVEGSASSLGGTTGANVKPGAIKPCPVDDD